MAAGRLTSEPCAPGYRLGLFVVKPLLTVVLRPRISGREHIPERGGFVVVANHESAIDPFVVSLAFSRSIRWLAKAELFGSRLVGILLRAAGAIPVERGAGDERAIAAARQMLDRGAAVGIFPQGTCLPDRHRPFRRGAARLALETGAPIVPVALVNTERVLPPGSLKIGLPRVAVVVGEPIRVERGSGSHEAAGRLTELIERAVATLRASGAPDGTDHGGIPRPGEWERGSQVDRFPAQS